MHAHVYPSMYAMLVYRLNHLIAGGADEEEGVAVASEVHPALAAPALREAGLLHRHALVVGMDT